MDCGCVLRLSAFPLTPGGDTKFTTSFHMEYQSQCSFIIFMLLPGTWRSSPIAALFIFHLTMTKEAKVWALQPASDPMGVGCQSCLLLELRRENVCGFVCPLSSRIHLSSISRVSGCQQNMTWLCTRLFCIMWEASIHILTAVEMMEEEHSTEHENYESQCHSTGGNKWQSLWIREVSPGFRDLLITKHEPKALIASTSGASPTSQWRTGWDQSARLTV